MHKYVYMYACSIYTAIIMDKWFMVAKVRPLSSHCKPKEFSWVSEKKMSLLQFLLQHCQTFLSAHATSLHGQDFFSTIWCITNPKINNQDLAIEQIL